MSDVELVAEARDVDAILRERPAGVIIATPAATHAEIALRFVEAGIATFIEKPMTIAVADAVRVRDAALRSNTLVFVGHIYLYNPAFQKAQELLPRVGRVLTVMFEGKSSSPRTDSSVLWDWLPHGLSMAHALFGTNPTSVQAWGTGNPLRLEEAMAMYVFGSVLFISQVSWLSPVKRKRMFIKGEEATLILDDAAEKKLSLCEPHGISFPAYDQERPLARELRAFIDAISAESKGTTELARGVSIVREIAAAEDSARNAGQLVTMSDL
jgi:predicted dehydrogenase